MMAMNNTFIIALSAEQMRRGREKRSFHFEAFQGAWLSDND